MAEELVGGWKLIESEGFDEYMEKCGVPFATRKIAITLKPVLTICKNGDKWNIKTESVFKNTDLPFVLNEVFEETTADGRKCETIMTLEDKKLVQKQKWNNNESTITREVQNGQLITICIFGDMKCRRVYNRK